MAAKPLGIRFNEIDKFMKIYHGTRYLVLLGHIWYDKIGDSIKYLISGKSGITDSINCNFGRIRIDSYNSLPIEKIQTFHVTIFIKSVVNKNRNKYYHNIYLKNGSYKDKSNTKCF